MQGVEPRARGRARLDGRLLRQHARAEREHVAARRVRRAGGADPDHRRRADARPGRRRGRRRGLPLADGVGRVQALHPRRLPRRLPDRRDLPYRVRHRRRAAGRLQRLRLLRPGLPVRRPQPARSGKPDGRVWKCTLCYDRTKDGLEPACAKACPTDSIQFGPLDELRERADARLAKLQDEGWNGAQLYGRDPDGPSAGSARSSSCWTSPRRTGCRRTRSIRRRTSPSRGRRPSLRAPRSLQQRCSRSRAGGGGASGSSHKVRSRATQPVGAESYYGRPILKEPTWTWEAPLYLFAGGIAGGAAALAAGCPARGERRARPSARLW